MIHRLDSFSKFDLPIDYSRIGYNDDGNGNCEVAHYPGNYNLLDDTDGLLTFKAVPDPGHEQPGIYKSSRLVTKDTLVLKPPFSVSCEAKWTLHSGAFYCPFWIFPTNPYIVCEIDGVEWQGGKPGQVHFTYHNTGKKILAQPVGESPYDHEFHSRSTYKPFNYNSWNSFRVNVYKSRIVWYMNYRKVKCLLVFGLNMEYYIRSTVQVATWAINPSLQSITEINPAIMQLIDFKVET